MRKILLIVLVVVLACSAALAEEDRSEELMACYSGLQAHMAFCLPGMPQLIAEQDMPGYATGNRQLVGVCGEDGAEFQVRSGDIAGLIDVMRVQIRAGNPEADENIVRINALLSYCMLIPSSYGAEPENVEPHGYRDRDWLWLTYTFTYPDTPGVTYYGKALLEDTQAFGLVIQECPHAQAVLDSFRLVKSEEELAALQEGLRAETAVDFHGLELVFPREPMREALDGYEICRCFSAEWDALSVQYQPNPMSALPEDDDALLETMTGIAAEKMLVPFETVQVREPVLSRPAPGVGQLDFGSFDETYFGPDYGQKLRCRLYVSEYGVWYVYAPDTEGGRAFIEAIRLDVPAEPAEAPAEPEPAEAPAEPEPAEAPAEPEPAEAPAEPGPAEAEPAAEGPMTLSAFRSGLEALLSGADGIGLRPEELSWCEALGSGGEWIVAVLPDDIDWGLLNIYVDGPDGDPAIRELRLISYMDVMTDKGKQLAGLCVSVLAGEAAEIAIPDGEETTRTVGRAQVSEGHFDPAYSDLIYDRVRVVPQEVPPLRDVIPFPEGESIHSLSGDLTISAFEEHWESSKDMMMGFTLSFLMARPEADGSVDRFYLVEDTSSLVVCYTDGEGDDAPVEMIVIMDAEGNAPQTLGLTLLAFASAAGLDKQDMMAMSSVLMETPMWNDLADLWPLLCRGDVVAHLTETSMGEDMDAPTGIISGRP